MLISGILERKGGELVVITPDEPVPAAARVLAKRRIGALPVTTLSGKLTGIISERDITRGFAQHGAMLVDLIVGDLMTREVVTCAPDDRASDVATTMESHRIRHVPVIDGDQLTGIISIRDLVSYRLNQLETDVDVLRQQLLGDVANL